MMPAPTGMTEVFETERIPTEEWTWVDVTCTAHRIFKVWINLHLEEKKQNREMKNGESNFGYLCTRFYTKDQ